MIVMICTQGGNEEGLQFMDLGDGGDVRHVSVTRWFY